MKKLSGLLFLALVLSAPLCAQSSKVILDESFYDNSNNWPMLDEDKVETSIDEGCYIIETSNDNGTEIFRETALDYSKNFSIETECQIVEGEDNYSYGIIFGYKNWNNYYQFLVTPNRFYKITHVYQGIIESTGWVKNQSVYARDYSNKIRIVKINDWIGFYLNDTFIDDLKDKLVPSFVDAIRADGFAGKQIGLVLNAKMKVKYDKLVVTELGDADAAVYMDQVNQKAAGTRLVTLLSDDFSDNRNNWAGSDKDSSSVKGVKDGVYSFESRSKDAFKSSKNVFLSEGGDYEIQCTAKWVSGTDSSYYGILWGYFNWKGYQEFSLNQKGSCRYLNAVSGKEIAVSASYQPGAENLIKISKVRDSLYFYVNGTLALKAQNISPAGSEAGFIVYNKQKVLFDNLKITQARTYPKVLQEVTTAEETLQKNEGPFSDKNTQNGFTKLWKPGILECTHSTGDGHAVWDEFYIDPKEDFIISEKIKWVSGDTTQGYGIVWGQRDWKHANEFLISRDGYFKCISFIDDNTITTGWKKASWFLKSTENTLMVKKCGSFVEYYIDNQLVDILPFYGVFGYSTGLLVFGKQTAGIENLTIKELKVSKPVFEQNKITFKEDYNLDKPSLQGMDKTGSRILLTDKGKLHLAASFPELQAYTGSDVSQYTSGNMLYTETRSSTRYPNQPFYQANNDVLPSFDDQGRPSKAFSVEVTVGLMSSAHSRGAGLRIGGSDFLVDADGNYVMDIKEPQPFKDDTKPGTKIYRLKVECEVNGLMYFYINGKMAGFALEAIKDRSAGPIIYAFNTLTEAWFDDFVIRTY
ncbi:MAG TPA: hypothetical protein VHO43_06865 [Ignavibacteriales bacterium]|nr:hypothetical protein [Ignavibacteriales bacterium]